MVTQMPEDVPEKEWHIWPLLEKGKENKSVIVPGEISAEEALRESGLPNGTYALRHSRNGENSYSFYQIDQEKVHHLGWNVLEASQQMSLLSWDDVARLPENSIHARCRYAEPAGLRRGVARIQLMQLYYEKHESVILKTQDESGVTRTCIIPAEIFSAIHEMRTRK